MYVAVPLRFIECAHFSRWMFVVAHRRHEINNREPHQNIYGDDGNRHNG